jgi:SAM-dependent methyltransferase
VQPYSSQISEASATINGETAYANIFGFASTLYFCIPNNPKLMGYWDTVADRLFKIRHCQNMQGVFRKLSLFEPPIDPGLLVRAAAQGLSISSVLNDLNTPMPNYRFYYLLQKALELCNELKSLGGAMLSAIEKRDNETIALMRARHESSMHNLVMEVKKQQLEEAIKSVETLQQNRKSPESRMKYYLQLIGEAPGNVPSFENDFAEIINTIEVPVDEGGLKLIKYEKEELDKANLSASFQFASGVPETLAGILYALPMLAGDVKPLGVGAGASFGGTNLGQLTQTVSKGLQITAGYLSHQSSTASKKAGYQRALQDRIQQANAAGYEIKQIDKQILAQQIRIDIANLEIKNQQQQIDNSREVEDFLRNKFSDEELYTWMRDSLKTLYAQVYSLAYDLAKKAEKVYRFERGLSDSGFIKPGYWDAGREGLLAGEHLYVGLKQLEAAYHENRGYDYEITRHISLRQLNPNALLELRAHGKCEFELPEYLFDMDFPGHYRRRIKSLSLSIPCIAGPYTGINAVLRLQKHKYRHTALEVGYGADSDENFSTNLTPITSIALSTAQNDSGMFELNFKDERYLPFEGAGVISRWKLELPDIRQFDYETITDIVVHLRYTAVEGGAALKNAANKSVINVLANAAEASREGGLFLLLDLKNEFPNEWHRARNQGADFELVIGKERFPYFAQTFDISPVDDVHRFFNSKFEPINSGSVTSVLGEISVKITEADYSEPVFLVLGYGLKAQI